MHKADNLLLRKLCHRILNEIVTVEQIQNEWNRNNFLDPFHIQILNTMTELVVIKDLFKGDSRFIEKSDEFLAIYLAERLLGLDLDNNTLYKKYKHILSTPDLNKEVIDQEVQNFKG